VPQNISVSISISDHLFATTVILFYGDPSGKDDQIVKLTTYYYLVLKLMSGIFLPVSLLLPGVLLKHRSIWTLLYLTFICTK